MQVDSLLQIQANRTCLIVTTRGNECVHKCFCGRIGREHLIDKEFAKLKEDCTYYFANM